ncbi:MAG TPA: hypothetical protein VGK44_19235 [Casimicrobiaceae bacterium]|jgi:hypothetical protein
MAKNNFDSDDEWLHVEAAAEYDAIKKFAEQTGNQALANALVDFWRMYIDIKRDPKCLKALKKLTRSSGRDDGTTFRELVCCPDDEGIVAIIGEKDGIILALSFERFESPAWERVWKDAQSRANARASGRRLPATKGRNG